jgi:hypothetical protein
MDFIEGLPASGSTNCILVVIDKFTKLAHFFTSEASLHSTVSSQGVLESGL